MDEGIFLSQRKYVLDIVGETGLLGSKHAVTSMEQNHKLASDDGPLFSDPGQYSRLIGRIVYLAISHHELSYSIHLLSQFMQTPRQAHWDAALHVVRYLKGSLGQGILLRADTNIDLSIYCDSDWQSSPLTRRSLSSYVVMLGGFPIAWKTKKQDTVSHSSVEVEYRAMAYAVKEIKWIVPLVKDLGASPSTHVSFYCDSQVAIHIASNPVFQERTKHIERDYHCVRDAAHAGLVSMRHVRTKDQLADILTKALGRPQFDFLLSKLGVQPNWVFKIFTLQLEEEC